MAVTHLPATIGIATNAVTALINAGTPPGKLCFRLTGTAAAPGTIASTLTLANPAFGTAVTATGIATAGTITADSSATGNASPVATATLQDSAGNVVIHCAVAASSSDINFTNGLTIGAGDQVSCSSLTYQAIGS